MELVVICSVVLAAVVVAALFAEVLARRWIRSGGKYFVWRPHYKKVEELNPAYSRFLESPIHFYANREGERGKEVPKTAGKLYRVLVAGGSTAECMKLNQDKAWPALLERILEANKSLMDVDAIHVGNIAKSNVEGRGLSLTLEKVLPRYPRLDLVILVPGIAPVGRWLGDGCPADRPANPLPMRMLFAQYPEIEFGWGLKNTALAELTQRWLFRLTSHPQRLTGVGRVKIAAASQRSTLKEFYPLIEDPSEMVSSFEKELRVVLSLVQAKAKRVILVRPFWFAKDHFAAEEDANMWLGWVGKPKPGEQWQYPSHQDLFRLYARLDQKSVKVAQEMEVEVIDLKGLLEARLGIYYDNCHLAEEGASIVAHYIASVVLGSSIIKMIPDEPSPAEVAPNIGGRLTTG